MSIFVYLAVLAGFANLIGMWGKGLDLIVHGAILGLAGVFAALALWKPGPDRLDGRMVAVLGALLAAVPVLRGPVRELRHTMKERAYAKEIAPLVIKLRTEESALEAAFKDAARDGMTAPPHFQNGTLVVASQGAGAAPRDAAAAAAAAPPLTLPEDPFAANNARTRYWTDGRSRWVLLSNGPDKQADVSVPPSLRATDRVDWRARWIANNNRDLRALVFDPNGPNRSLGTGDVLFAGGWPGAGAGAGAASAADDATAGSGSASNATDAFDPATLLAETGAAWELAREAIGKTTEGGGDACLRAIAASRMLLGEGKALAALAAAGEAASQIPPLPKDQKVEHFAAFLLQGQSLYALGDTRYAANALTLYVTRAPNDPEGYYWLGASLLVSGDAQQARRALAAASQIQADHPLAVASARALAALDRRETVPLPAPGSALTEKAAK